MQESVVLSEFHILDNMSFGAQMSYYKGFFQESMENVIL